MVPVAVDPYERPIPNVPVQPGYCQVITFDNAAALTDGQIEECQRFLALRQALEDGATELGDLGVNQRFLVESRDEGWAENAERMILDAVAQIPGGLAVTTFAIECKATSCRMEFLYPSTESRRAQEGLIGDALQGLDSRAGLTEMRAVQQGIGGPFIFWLSRDRESNTQSVAQVAETA
jgi:hypothetical protein